jgi:hypothetical protein
MWLIGGFVNWEYSYIFSMLGMLVTAGWFVVHTYQLFSYETPYYAYYNIWHDKNGNAYSSYQEGYDARCAEREWKLKLSFRNRIRKAKNQHKYFGIKAMWESFKEKHCSRVKLDKRSW